MTYYVYMLACYKGSSFDCFYTGYTKDLKRRLREHERNAREGRRRKFTGRFEKVELAWYCECDSRDEAREEEKRIKSLNSSSKRRLVRELALKG